MKVTSSTVTPQPPSLAAPFPKFSPPPPPPTKTHTAMKIMRCLVHALAALISPWLTLKIDIVNAI